MYIGNIASVATTVENEGPTQSQEKGKEIVLLHYTLETSGGWSSNYSVSSMAKASLYQAMTLTNTHAWVSAERTHTAKMVFQVNLSLGHVS